MFLFRPDGLLLRGREVSTAAGLRGREVEFLDSIEFLGMLRSQPILSLSVFGCMREKYPASSAFLLRAQSPGLGLPDHLNHI
jgi:hypothetical protein